jgi:hypothetical protein
MCCGEMDNQVFLVLEGIFTRLLFVYWRKFIFGADSVLETKLLV